LYTTVVLKLLLPLAFKKCFLKKFWANTWANFVLMDLYAFFENSQFLCMILSTLIYAFSKKQYSVVIERSKCVGNSYKNLLQSLSVFAQKICRTFTHILLKHYRTYLIFMPIYINYGTVWWASSFRYWGS